MDIGIIIEDNFMRICLRDETGYPVFFKCEGLDEYDADIILFEDFAYTGSNISPVKLAKPALPLYKDVLYPDQTKFTDKSGGGWSRAQILAVHFKKLIFLINANQVDLVSDIVVSHPPYFTSIEILEIRQALEANNIDQIKLIPWSDGISDLDEDLENAKIVSISESDFRDMGKRPKKIRCTLRNLLHKALLDQTQAIMLVPGNSALDQYLMKCDLDSILQDILHDRAQPSYFLVTDHQVINFVPPIDLIEIKLKAVIKSLLQGQTGLNANRLVFTGRLVQCEKVRTVISELLDGKATSYSFDLQNECMHKSMLNTLAI